MFQDTVMNLIFLVQ